MAIHKSDLVSNRENGIKNKLGTKGKPVTQMDVITFSGAVADNDVIVTDILIPIDAIILSVKFASDKLGTTGDFNLGFHKGNVDVSTLTDSVGVVDEDALAVDIDVNAAVVTNAEHRFNVNGIESALSSAWSLCAALSARPTDYKTLRLTLTASEATTASGDCLVTVQYLQ